MSDSPTPPTTGRNPNAMPVADLAAILAKLTGRPLTAAMVEADLAAGAPYHPDGSMHLIHYGAWLLREAYRPGGDRRAR
jgi:hypothetical protein